MNKYQNLFSTTEVLYGTAAAAVSFDQRGFSNAAEIQIRVHDVITLHGGHTLDYVQTCFVSDRYIEQPVIWGMCCAPASTHYVHYVR